VRCCTALVALAQLLASLSPATNSPQHTYFRDTSGTYRGFYFISFQDLTYYLEDLLQTRILPFPTRTDNPTQTASMDLPGRMGESYRGLFGRPSSSRENTEDSANVAQSTSRRRKQTDQGTNGSQNKRHMPAMSRTTHPILNGPAEGSASN